MRRRSLLASSRRTRAADDVLAATAGLDNWKTWAGRSHGSDDFEYLDVFRGVTRTLNHRLFLANHRPPPGATCPVCFCEPENNEEWHVTSSCGHAVCLDCLNAYASNQVRDQEQQGPLKCPVCPQVLRKRDAIVALGGNKELIRLWDVKIRNQLLRALPAYRSCPKCSDADSGGGGGGFVTPECLAPHYQERRETAKQVLRGLSFVVLSIFALWFLFVVWISKTPSPSAAVDLFFMLAPIYIFVKAGRAAQGWVAQAARQSLFRPITVECPCCDSPFILPAESTQVQDDETSRWMDANTRPCPSCSVPIHKDGGCNHMRCGHCHASFCWACMRLRTDCGAYKCKHGAPYRDALPGTFTAQQPQPNDSILTTIDYILGRRSPRLELTIQDGMVILFALLFRQFAPPQTIVDAFMTPLATVFGTGIVVLGYVLKVMVESLVLGYVLRLVFSYLHRYERRLRRARRHDRPVRRAHRHDHPVGYRHNLRASELLLGVEERNERDRHRNLQRINMTEQEMIAEALRRSVQDQ